MSKLVAYGMVGFETLWTTATRRAIAGHMSTEQAFGQLSAQEARQAAAAEMPPGPRAAYLAGPKRGDKPPSRYDYPRPLAEQALQQAIAANPQFTLKAQAPMKSMQQQSTLTPSEVTTAQAMFRRMAEPLNASEREVCAKLGIPEADFLAERNREIGEALPGVQLTADERKLQHVFNLSLDDVMKARQG